MKIDITMQQTCSDNKTSCQVARRVRFALSRFGASIRIITVRITDINGPKGGLDTRCVVSVKLAAAGEVVVQGEGENVFSALNYCLSRAGRTISRNLERRRDTPIRMMNRRKSEVRAEPLLLDDERDEFSL